MSIGSLLFFIRETFISMRRSTVMNIIAIATVTITLIILGLFLLISLNFKKVTDDIVSRLEIRIFLKSNLNIEDIQIFRRKLRSVDGIKSVEFINSNMAWKSFKIKYDHLNLDDFITKSPLPHSLTLKLESSQDMQSIILYLKRFDTLIDDIVYGGELANRVDICRQFMSIGGGILIVLLVLASIFIIINTIRLTVIARNEEITIMRLVGATDRFIKCPFLFEGFFIGILGAGFSTGLIATLYSIVITQVTEKMPFFSFITDYTYLNYIYGFVVFSGAFIGMIGAYISVSRSLKVR